MSLTRHLLHRPRRVILLFIFNVDKNVGAYYDIRIDVMIKNIYTYTIRKNLTVNNYDRQYRALRDFDGGANRTRKKPYAKSVRTETLTRFLFVYQLLDRRP